MAANTFAGRPGDRLATALFVAALLHGLLILGVRFAAPPADDRPLPTLEVLLVPAGPPEADDPQAAYLADRSQRGAGTGRDGRTSLPEASASVFEQAGDEHGVPLAPPAPERGQAGVALLAAPAPRGPRHTADEAAEPAAPVARPVESRPLAQLGVNASAAEETLRLRGDPSPDDRLLADTRESQIAAYLDGWKRHVEQVGTLHFPEEARRRSSSGNPVLEVAVRSDGSLQQVVVRRSSGQRELDVAAIGIVRLAAPFAPFPAAMRERYPLLRFAYEWQFQGGRAGAGQPQAPAP